MTHIATPTATHPATHATTDAKTLLMQQFQQILRDRQRQAYRVATKAEEAQKLSDREQLERAATYTPDSIVRGLADLQLDFNLTVTSLGDRLEAEADKLNALRQAIVVERNHGEQLQKIRIVADALHLLHRENQEKQRERQDAIAAQHDALDRDIDRTRKAWDKAQKDFEAQAEDAAERRQKQRAAEEADEQYALEQQRQRDADDYARLAREQEIELAEHSRIKEKDWSDREDALDRRQAEIDRQREQAAHFDEQLKQAFETAKADAIREVNREANSRASLLEKTWDGTQQSYEVKIAALNAAIAQQDEQIADLSSQLQTALQQARELSVQAFSKNTAKR